METPSSKSALVGFFAVAYGSALAQFGASGGPSRDLELLVECSWLLVGSIFLLAWFGPKGVRRVLLRVLLYATVAYVGVAIGLLILGWLLRPAFGSLGGPFDLISGIVAGLVILSWAFPGPTLLVLIVLTLAFIGGRTLVSRYWGPVSGPNTAPTKEETTIPAYGIEPPKRCEPHQLPKGPSQQVDSDDSQSPGAR